MTNRNPTIQSVADRLERLVSRGQSSAVTKAPSGPQLRRPELQRSRGGLSPWLVVGAAFAGGYLAAKLIDWRSHAHPR